MTIPAGRCLLALGEGTLAPTPTWTRIDDTANLLASYSIDRGRQFELDRTDGGRATVSITDKEGVLDPTNAAGPYYGEIEPLVQAMLGRYNPVLAEWQTRFRGFVEDFSYDFDPSQRVNRLTLNLVDIFEIINAVEMLPGAFGDVPPPTGNEREVWFDNRDVNDQIFKIYRDAGLPDEFFVIFSGNVGLYESLYSSGESAMTALQEAVDAEFPGVSNFYPDRFGRGCFHGRLAKFDPEGTAASTTPDRWDFQHWKAGDGAAVAASLSDTAQIREFAFNRGLAQIINSAVATPIGIADAAVAGQVFQDATSIGLYGVRSWSAQNLLTKIGLLDGSTALQETLRFAQWRVDTYKQPQNRIAKVSFASMRPDDARAAPNWKLLCQVDIADRIDITVTSPGGGGFSEEPSFIEGVHETSSPLTPEYDDVRLSLDVSPQPYFVDTEGRFPTA